MANRRERMLGDACQPGSLGIEIGALHAPLIRPGPGRVLYVDYAPTDTLRANFRHQGVDPGEIVEVNIVWGERPLREAVGEPADYIVASHVIEHVPDLIGWLLELHGALRPGGLIGLAIPDRRFTFDIRRQVSTAGEMVEAYLQTYRRPSLRQIFDAAALSNDAGAETWRFGENPAAGLPAEVLGRLAPALAMVREVAVAPRYVDAHCWIFTPPAFLDIAQALAAMGVFPFVIEALFPTEPDSPTFPDKIEFQVRLRTVTDPADPAIAASIAAARARLSAMAPDDALVAENAALRREVAALQAGMAELRRSTSWRLTAPLRMAGRVLRRRKA